MCLRFVYFLIVSVFSWTRLARRQGAWKEAEILLLRHQLGVLQRQQVRRPRLTWADRALIAALAGVIPKTRRVGLRLLVTPDTVSRWHRDLLRRRWAAKSRAGRSGRPATRREIRVLNGAQVYCMAVIGSRSGGAIALAASSTSTPWSHDMDEVFGTHTSI
jgi:putative transposase